MSSTDREEGLPVGVLLPTRNSMPLLERHLEGLRSWLHRAEEVVVVDSHSTDGTADYLAENLSHPSLKILQHPPGLYESWNFGIRHIGARWLYISTVGDCIAQSGIGALVSACAGHELDVAISAPLFLSPSGERIEKNNWPVHRYIQRTGKSGRSHVMPSVEVFLWNTLFAPGSLMGSSASNLYRTAYMKAHPFRTDLGHAGDLAWGIENAFSARWGVVPGCHSEFLLHPPVSREPQSTTPRIKEELFALSRRIFQQEMAAGVPTLARYSDELSAYWAASARHLSLKDRYAESFGGKKAAFLDTRLWSYRIRQLLYSRKRTYYREKVLEKLYS